MDLPSFSEILVNVKRTIFENDLFGGAFYLSVLGFIFFQLKTIPLNIYTIIKKNIVYTIYFDQENQLFPYFEDWLYDNYEHKYKILEARLERGTKKSQHTNSHNDKKVEDHNNISKKRKYNINYYQFSDSFIIFYKGAFLKIRKGREKLENASKLSNLFLNHFYITGIFSKSKIKKILFDLSKMINDDDIKQHTNYINVPYYDSWSRNGKLRNRSINTVIIDKKIKEYLVNNIDNFLKSENKYIERGISYKLGIMLHGKPGNGKTSLIKSLAFKYNKDIYNMNLSDMTDEKFGNVIHHIPENVILVFEDIDCIFKDKRHTNKNKLSLNSILNVLDGIMTKNNLIIIMTTNHIEKLDDALIRTGRVDLKIEIENPTNIEIEKYYKQFFNEDIKIKKYNKDFSMSDVQQLFIENEYNKKRKQIILEKLT